MSTKFETGSFNDYKGEEHKFVIAATTINATKNRAFDICEGVFDGPDDETGDWTAFPVERVLGIGISICSPEDEFDLEIGKKQAEGRSKVRCNRLIGFTKGGCCSSRLIDLILQETKANLMQSPEKFIPGYDKAKEKWIQSSQKKALE